MHGRAHIEHFLHPRVRRFSPNALHVNEDVELDIGAQHNGKIVANAGVALPGDGADVDADLGLVRDGVDIDAAVHPADVERRRAHYRVARDVETELLQLGDCARCLVDRVDAPVRHRAMRGDAARRRFEPKGALVATQCAIGGGLRHDQCARGPAHSRSRQHEGALASRFLAGRDVEHDPRRA